MGRKLVSSKLILLFYILWVASLIPVVLYFLGRLSSALALPFAALSLASSVAVSFMHIREEKAPKGS